LVWPSPYAGYVRRSTPVVDLKWRHRKIDAL
jgi:hypothetical protein